MAKTKQVVRKTSSAPLADFDEQWWPITVLLLISAGCLAGFVWLKSDFTDPNPLRNGWVQLSFIGGTVLVLLVGVAMLRGGAQRRLQLGVFLSLAFHLALLYTTQKVYLALAPEPPAIDGELEEDVRVTIPDYLPTQESGRERDDLARPADAPIQNEPSTDVAPQLPTPIDPEKPAVQEPDPQRQAPHDTPELKRPEFTAPRSNVVLSGPSLSRKELTDKLPTDQVPDRQLNAASQPELAMNAPKLEAERQETADSPTRRPDAAQIPSNRPRPDLAQFMPQRTPQEEQVAAMSLNVQMPRRAIDAAVQGFEAAAAPSPAPRTVDNVPQPPSAANAATTGRLTPAAQQPVGSPSQVASPNVTFTPNSANVAEPTRAETTDPSLNAVASITPRQPSRIPSGTPGTAGAEAVPFETPVAPATTSTSPGGASPDAAATSINRGNLGSPQQVIEQGMNLPSPLGSGTGTTVGGSTLGPRRTEMQGETGSGLAAAAQVAGRQSRARAGGPANAPVSAVPASSLAGVAGAANTPGTAPSGSAAALQPSASAAGIARGSSSGSGAVALPSGAGSLANSPAATTSAGAGVGTGSGLTGSGTAIARRDVGGGVDSDATGSATAVGRSTLAKLSPGDALVALPGTGMIAVPTTSPRADTTSRGGDVSAPSSVSGAAGIRREAAGLPVLVTAPVGPGGLTVRPSTDVGIPSPRARQESEVAHLEMNRLIPERIGGKRSGGGVVRDTAVEGLKQRDPSGRGELARAMGGSEATEQAVELGLDFLARSQADDGSWRLHDHGADMQSNTAGTGLALLAFLGAGYTHTDAKYAAVVEKGLAYLLRRQKADGDLFVPPPNAAEANTWLYSHGIASIALCEAYGMTRDDELLRAPAQKAIDFIVAAQNLELGGWRYLPRIGSDTSVSGWQLMALKSAERVGLSVPPKTYTLVTKWLDFAEGAGGDPTRYAYMPQSEFDHQRVVSRVMTAEALLMRQYLGWNRNHPYLTGGADFLLTQLPAIGTTTAPNRDSYYWYYATQVMFHMKGEHWRRWNEKLRPLLVDSQEQTGPVAGSWEPMGVIPDRWGGAGGRVYVTAMHLLMLEVYYRYLPLYQNLEE